MVRALSSNLNVHKSKTLFNFSGIKHKVSEKKRNKSKVKRVAVYKRLNLELLDGDIQKTIPASL